MDANEDCIMNEALSWLTEKMPDIISDLWNIQLSIIGITVSVMTLLFASHVGKAESYKHVCKSKEINEELLSIYLSNGMKIYKSLSNKALTTLIIFSVLFVYTTVLKYLSNASIVLWVGVADLLFSVGILVRTIYMIAKVVGQYKKETK